MIRIMAIKIDNNDMIGQILENEFKIKWLEKLVDKILSTYPEIISEEEITTLRTSALRYMQEKYPTSGIEFKTIITEK